MRIAVKALNSDATLNNFEVLDQFNICKGDTAVLNFQLYDAEKGLRYIPAAGATLTITISRFPQYLPTPANARETVDYTITGSAANPFADDRSIWTFSLTALQTATLTSSAVKFVLTEGSVVRNVTVPMMISASNQDLN